MAEHIQRVRHINTPLEQSEEVDDTTVTHTDQQSDNMVSQLVSYLTSALLVLLAVRFVFALLGANPANSIANFIYTVSHPFVAPFFSLFSYNLRYGVSRVEAYTLVAMLIYGIVGYGLARLSSIKRHPVTN